MNTFLCQCRTTLLLNTALYYYDSVTQCKTVTVQGLTVLLDHVVFRLFGIFKTHIE